MQGASLAPIASIAGSAAIASEERRLCPFDRSAVAALHALELRLRFGMAARKRFNSDELQHFHVAWGWLRELGRLRHEARGSGRKAPFPPPPSPPPSGSPPSEV